MSCSSCGQPQICLCTYQNAANQSLSNQSSSISSLGKSYPNYTYKPSEITDFLTKEYCDEILKKVKINIVSEDFFRTYVKMAMQTKVISTLDYLEYIQKLEEYKSTTEEK